MATTVCATQGSTDPYVSDHFTVMIQSDISGGLMPGGFYFSTGTTAEVSPRPYPGQKVVKLLKLLSALAAYFILHSIMLYIELRPHFDRYDFDMP